MISHFLGRWVGKHVLDGFMIMHVLLLRTEFFFRGVLKFFQWFVGYRILEWDPQHVLSGLAL